MFELKLPSGTIQLKWGYFAMKQFCAKHNLKPTEYFLMLSEGDSILNYVTEFLLIGAEYAAAKSKSDRTFSEIEVCEWIDEAGGVKAEGVIMDYLKYVIASHTTNLSEKEEAEKKS
jgi:hypothetical protein